LIATLLAIAAAGAPVPADAHGIATRISRWGPRPAASRGEARAQRLIGRAFRDGGLRVGVQEFRVPGKGRSARTTTPPASAWWRSSPAA